MTRPNRYFCPTCWRSFIPPRARILLGVLGALTLVALGIGSAVWANSGEQELTVVTRKVQVVRTTTGPVEMVTLAPKRLTVNDTTTLSGTTKTLPGRTVTVQRAGRTVVVRRPGRTVTVPGPVRERRRVVLKPVVEEKRVVLTTPGRTVTTPRVTVTQPPQTSTETRTVTVDRPVTVTTDRPVTQTVNRPVTTTVTQTQTAESVTQTVTQTQAVTQTVTNTVTVTAPPPPRKP